MHAATQLEAFYCKAQVHGVSLTATGELLAVGTSEHTEIYQLTKRPLLRLPSRSRRRRAENLLPHP